MFFSKATWKPPVQQAQPQQQPQPVAQQPAQQSMMFGGQQNYRPMYQPFPQQQQAPDVDMNNIYGGLRGQFDADALRKALIARYANVPGVANNNTPIGATARAQTAPMTTYAQQVNSGMNDFAQLIRAMGGFRGGS